MGTGNIKPPSVMISLWCHDMETQVRETKRVNQMGEAAHANLMNGNWMSLLFLSRKPIINTGFYML